MITECRSPITALSMIITMVGTAATLKPRLLESKVQPSAIDVVPYDGY